MRRCDAARRGSAFTIIELLVVVAVLGVIIAIAAPAISSARTSAASAGSLVNLREHGLWLAAYANDHRDELLNPFRKGAPDASVKQPWRDRPTAVPFLPDSFSAIYATLVGHDLIADQATYEQAFFAPLDPYLDELRESAEASHKGAWSYHDALTPASYCYSSAMYQMNQRFTERGTNRPPIARRMFDEIAYPARKVAFHERADFAQGRTIDDQPRWFETGAVAGVLFADGHVDRVAADTVYAAIAAGNESVKPVFSIDVRFAHDPDRERHPLDFRNPGLFWATRRGLAGVDVP
ncbi:MAG: prepilin-type N-terminal cleavage/methylation domain-containing protein [Phycisphaerales bacterium]|nr:prepilin-type N-terminal cleavage/methylation domain-containing protein [Phycisphaerales bacterium]